MLDFPLLIALDQPDIRQDYPRSLVSRETVLSKMLSAVTAGILIQHLPAPNQDLPIRTLRISEGKWDLFLKPMSFHKGKDDFWRLRAYYSQLKN